MVQPRTDDGDYLVERGDDRGAAGEPTISDFFTRYAAQAGLPRTEPAYQQ